MYDVLTNVCVGERPMACSLLMLCAEVSSPGPPRGALHPSDYTLTHCDDWSTLG